MSKAVRLIHLPGGVKFSINLKYNIPSINGDSTGENLYKKNPSNTEFSDVHVTVHRAKFSDVHLTVHRAKFSDVHLTVHRAKFSDVHLTVHRAKFSDVHVTVHRAKFLIIKPTRCTNFSNLFLE